MLRFVHDLQRGIQILTTTEFEGLCELREDLEFAIRLGKGAHNVTQLPEELVLLVRLFQCKVFQEVARLDEFVVKELPLVQQLLKHLGGTEAGLWIPLHNVFVHREHGVGDISLGLDFIDRRKGFVKDLVDQAAVIPDIGGPSGAAGKEKERKELKELKKVESRNQRQSGKQENGRFLDLP